MLALRYSWLWWAGGLLLVLGVCAGSLTPADKMPSVGLEVHDKALHAGAYFAMMVWFAGLYPRRLHVAIGLILLSLGTALDLIQSQMATRSFEVADIIADAVGILAGLVLSASLLEGWCQRLERVLFLRDAGP